MSARPGLPLAVPKTVQPIKPESSFKFEPCRDYATPPAPADSAEVQRDSENESESHLSQRDGACYHC